MTTARGRIGVVVIAFMLMAAGLASAAVPRIDAPAAEPQHQAMRVDPPSRAVIIGDSAIAALRWVPGADNAIVGFNHTLDLESCRRLYDLSCSGREGRRPDTVFDALDFHGGKYDTLVVATGYNDGPAAVDEAFGVIVDKARRLGFSRIVWWTLRSDVDYVSPASVGNHESFAQNNAVLRSLVTSGDYPDVVVADWGAYTADRADWFVTDGVHYRQVGAWGAADYLTRKMAFLDERPCPFATAPGEEPDDPCPDPDVTGPITDIEAMYPVGEDGVLCYEIGEERRIQCRVDTHVIRIERELRLGDSGDDVSALQTRLIRLEFLTGETTAEFADGTEAGVRLFQAAQSLPVTGIADVATLEALGFDVSAIEP